MVSSCAQLTGGGAWHTAPGALSLWLASDLVPGAGEGFDDGGVAEFLAQFHDGDADGVGEGVCVGVPDAFEEVFGADDVAVGGEEGVQDAEFLVGQAPGRGGPGGEAPAGVEGDGCPGKERGVGCLRAS